MSESNYTKVFTGNFIVIQQMVNELDHIGITPIVKDETESGRLAGFGSSIPGLQELFIHNDELAKATPIIEQVKSTLTD